MRNAAFVFITTFLLFLLVSPLIVPKTNALSPSIPSKSVICEGLGLFDYINCLFLKKESAPYPSHTPSVSPIQPPIDNQSGLNCMFYPQYTECQSFDSIKPTKPEDRPPLPDEPLPLNCRAISDQIYECDSILKVQPDPTRTSVVPSAGVKKDGCVRGGCSGQLCEDENGERLTTTCEWKEEYSCYQQAVCERQINGSCGFTDTKNLQMCLQQASISR